MLEVVRVEVGRPSVDYRTPYFSGYTVSVICMPLQFFFLFLARRKYTDYLMDKMTMDIFSHKFQFLKFVDKYLVCMIGVIMILCIALHIYKK